MTRLINFKMNILINLLTHLKIGHCSTYLRTFQIVRLVPVNTNNSKFKKMLDC